MSAAVGVMLHQEYAVQSLSSEMNQTIFRTGNPMVHSRVQWSMAIYLNFDQMQITIAPKTYPFNIHFNGMNHKSCGM
jgi:hypothetical protein